MTFAVACEEGTKPIVAAKASLHQGNEQTATVGTAVSVKPAVLVTDAADHPAAGIPVLFAAVSGGGSITGGVQLTDAEGIARIESWTLGTMAGPNAVVATVQRIPAQVTFTAMGEAGPAALLERLSGDGQSVTLGTAVPLLPSARVSDQYGNGVAGVQVAFEVTGGGGSITEPVPVTDASGIATIGSWTLGCAAGVNTLSASVSGLTGSPTEYSAEGTPAPPVASVTIQPTSFGMVLGDTVTLTSHPLDADGNPVPCTTTTTWEEPSSGRVAVSADGVVTAMERGFVTVSATTEGVPGAATMTVYAPDQMDSVTFVRTIEGVETGWVETTLTVGDTKCVPLFAFDANNRTVALRWEASTSDATVVRVKGSVPKPPGPDWNCFEAMKSGTAMVTGQFAGKATQKPLVVP